MADDSKRLERLRTRVAAATLGGLGLLLWIWVLSLPANLGPEFHRKLNLFGIPLSGEEFHRARMHDVMENLHWWVLVIGAALLAFRLFKGVREHRWAEKVRWSIYAALMLLTLWVSAAHVMQWSAHRKPYFDIGDTYHYFLGPKYFEELDYADLYLASFIALEEMGQPPARHVRNLRDNRKQPSANLLNPRRRKMIASRFTPQRWEEFKADVMTYRRWHSNRSWQRRVLDHGYNGSPPLLAVGRPLANLAPASADVLNTFASFNTLAIFAFLCACVFAFGWEVGLIVVLLFWLNYCDRFILGGAFLRYIWIASLGGGIVALAKRRFATSGALIALAASIQIFPVLYFFGMGAKAAWTFYRRRVVPIRFKRFFAGALAVFFVLGLMTMSPGVQRGFRTWQLFKEQMDIEARYADGRIGFVYNFLYPKQIMKSDPMPNFHRQLRPYMQPAFGPFSRKHLRWALTAGFLLFALVSLRRMTEHEATVFAGAALFFFLFSTVRYYYAGWAMLPLFWFTRRRSWEAWVGLGLMLVTSIVAYVCHENWSHSFIHNTVFVWFYTVYLAALVLLAWQRPIEQFRSWVRPTSTTVGQTLPKTEEPATSAPTETEPDESEPDESEPDESEPDESEPDESEPDESEPDEKPPPTAEV